MKTSSSPITLPAIGCCSNTMDAQTLPDLQPEQHPARKGKVARKPKTVRDRINQMMCDGVPYPQILARLGEDGADLNPQNLTNWRGGGYLEWLRSQTQIDRLRLRQELASNLITATSGTPVHEASRLLVASQLWELFLEFDAEASLQNLQATPELYPRFVATLARLCEADTASARQKTQETRLKARLQQGQDPAAPGLITTGTLQNISTKLNLH